MPQRLLTDHSQRIFRMANNIVARRQSDWLSSVDIFLAIICHNDQGKAVLSSPAYRILHDVFELNTADLYRAIDEEYGEICAATAHITHRNNAAEKQSASAAARQNILTLANQECERWGDNYINSEHLLLALLRQNTMPMIQSHLTPLGVTYPRACRAIAQQQIPKMVAEFIRSNRQRG